MQRNTTGAHWARRGFAVLLTASMILCGQSAMPASAESAPDIGAIRRMSLHVDPRKTAPPGTWRVTQDESLRLEFTADSPTTVHVHGYDMERRVTPATPAVITFAAKTTGRFPIVMHDTSGHDENGHRERVLLYLEVHPR